MAMRRETGAQGELVVTWAENVVDQRVTSYRSFSTKRHSPLLAARFRN